ncbi:RHS repeat protein [Ekhidna sp.]
MYYDERGRVVQTITENHKGGTDRLSNEQDWKGELQQMVLEHHSKDDLGVINEEVTILSEYVYAHNGELLETYQTIDDDPRILVASYNYNILGELVEKNVHQEEGSTAFLQSIDYRYDIRGALTRINDADLSDGEDDLFGMEYYYETPQSINNTNTTARFDGMVNAMVWNANNNPAGTSDFDKTGIGFVYDKQNRLKSTVYGTGASLNDAANANAYSMSVGSYDDNGNIQSLNRTSDGDQVDQLSYVYEDHSNKLKSVDDSSTSPDNAVGFDNRMESGGIVTEYQYDAMGNMVEDFNKEIEKITYNHLQLVESIQFMDGTKVSYTYDAARNRLAKEVLDADDNSIAKVDYIGAVEYLDDAINQVFTDEGRAYKQNGEYHHEYFYTDHQGNNRVAFGDLPDRNVYIATMEPSRIDYEKTYFQFPNDDIRSTAENHTPLGEGSVALNGTIAGREVGPAKVLTIANGDEVAIEIWAKYNNAFTTNTAVGSISSAIATAFGGASAGTGLENNASALTNALASPSSFLFANEDANSNEPRAYVQYIFFDASYTFKEEGTGYQAVTSASLDKFAKYESGTLTFNEPGYLFVYLVNETNEDKDVFFDDLKITHSSATRSFKVSQVNDFYPFGLPTSNSWRNSGYIDPGLLYQSSYASYDSLTGYYDFLSRNYDPVLGRFFAVDPAGQFSSPYTGMGNVPHFGTDPNGEIFGITAIFGSKLLAGIFSGAVIGAGTGAVSYSAQAAFSGNWDWGAFGNSIGMGAVSGAVAGGVGKALGGTGVFGEAAKKVGNGFDWSKEIGRAFTHGVTQQGVGAAFGNDPSLGGFTAGFGGSIMGSTLSGAKANKAHMIGASSLFGGSISGLSGGSFLEGFASSAIVAGANHALHDLTDPKTYREKCKCYNALVEAARTGGNLAGYGAGAVGAISQSSLVTGVSGSHWRGLNGKWYRIGWGGNQWTGARFLAFSRALSISSRLGFLRVGLGRLGTAGTIASVPFDYYSMRSGQITTQRFAYRATGAGVTIGASIGVGAVYGGPFGAAAGALISGSWWLGEQVYDMWNNTFIPAIRSAMPTGNWSGFRGFR